jgi:hypothetical protein
MFLGKQFIFRCDFCGETFHQWGYGLPDGMKWLPGNFLADKATRHICKSCLEKEKNGDEKPRDSGQKF